MFQLFHDTKIDFMGKKWLWITVSTVINIAALIVIPLHGINQAVEFTGGVEVVLRYAQTPALDQIRADLEKSGLPSVSVTTFGGTGDREISIRAGLPEQRAGEERDLAQRVTQILSPPDVRSKREQGMLDLNVADQATITRALTAGGIAPDQATTAAEAIATFRRENGGVFESLDQVKRVPGASAVANVLDQKTFVGPFGLRGQQVIEASVSGEMRWKAIWATVGALAGMLVYIWIRFQFQWGLGAIVALIHDTIFTLGLFSIAGYEANLPVVAAFLTLIGFSMNDTVVIYDRIRENMKTRGAIKFEETINESINQTLSRTIITSLLTWISVLALFLFGGPVLRPFSFVLLVGIIVGTYSSIYIAAPILSIWVKVFAKKEAEAAKKAPPQNPRGARV